MFENTGTPAAPAVRYSRSENAPRLDQDESGEEDEQYLKRDRSRREGIRNPNQRCHTDQRREHRRSSELPDDGVVHEIDRIPLRCHTAALS